VQYKHDSRLDEKRRHALDLHLNFIVDQTEKYSSWLSAGLQTGADSRQNSASHSPRSSINQEGKSCLNCHRYMDRSPTMRCNALYGVCIYRVEG